MATLRSLRSFVSKTNSLSKARLLTGRAFSTVPQLEEWENHEAVQSFVADSSFQSYTSPQFKFPGNRCNILSPMETFFEEIPTTLAFREEKLKDDPGTFEGQEDPLLTLFHRMNLTKKDWAPYAHFDPTKAYTRNLIYTDNETFTLLLLCWNVDAESKIHDHPCDGCWMQVLQGEVQECRYEYPADGEDGYLKCIADDRFHEGQVAFINDNIGLHKVGNPSKDTPAVTLHLYHPPFQKCRVWDDGSLGSAAKTSCATHFSEYGWVEGSALP